MRDFVHFYEACLRYKTEFGDLYVPASYLVEGYRLGDKVHAVRRGLAKLTDEERRMLEDIGFVWKVRHDYSFAEVYRLLSLYKAQNGTCDVPISYVSKSGIPLGRILRNLKNGWKKVSLDEALLLRNIGVQFNEESYEPKRHLKKPIESRKVKGLTIKPSYIVVSFGCTKKEDALEHLQQLVNDKMKEGYIPSGGIFIDRSYPNVTVHQVMVLAE